MPALARGIGNANVPFSEEEEQQRSFKPRKLCLRALISELAPTWRRHPDLNWG